MKVLGLDPSSTLTGYAVMSRPTKILDAGHLRPNGAKKPAWDRIVTMVTSLRFLLRDYRPKVIVIEVPTRSVGLRHKGKGAGLAIYGMAVGAACWEASVFGSSLVCVDANTWTGGVSKFKRQHLIAAEFPEYKEQLDRDRGGDLADAIGLCLWWYQGRKLVRSGNASKHQGENAP